MQTQAPKNVNSSNTNSNFVFEEIFSDKLESGGPVLLSQSQNKLLSRQRLKSQKDKNEKK